MSQILSSHIIYSPLSLLNIPSLVTFVNAAYRGESGRVGWTTESDLLEGQRIDAAMLGELHADPQTQIIMAHNDSQLVGCFELRTETTIAAPIICYLGMLTVAPSQQGSGMGSALLQEAKRLAIAAGAFQICIHVIHVRHELIAYYTRKGFVMTGKQVPFPSDNPKFGKPLRSDLYFEEMTLLL